MGPEPMEQAPWRRRGTFSDSGGNGDGRGFFKNPLHAPAGAGASHRKQGGGPMVGRKSPFAARVRLAVGIVATVL